MSKKFLTCEYCGNLLKLTDTRCPNCGANCSSVIKKYHEELESEKEQLRKENMARVKKIQNMSKTSIFIIIFSILLIIIAFISVFIFIIFKEVEVSHSDLEKDSSFDLPIKKKKVVKTTFNKVAEGSKYDLIIDKYEAFEYKNNMGVDLFNTPEGYQKVAFHFEIKNTSGKEIDILDPFFFISLKADGVVAEDCALETTPGYDVFQGKGSYEKLKGTHLFDGESVNGYVGFTVPKTAKTLTFTIDKEIVVEMDNPYYEKSE